MINVDDLLKPVTEDKPCGEDFSYHPSFQNLENLARGKPETQFSPAEEPPWKEVQEAAAGVLGQSKHLGAAVLLTRALVKLGGLEGLRDGLAVVRGITEKYWADVYPKLDPDDNNDPTERLNILNSLSSPKFASQLGELVLCQSPAMGRITLQQVLNARDKLEKPGASGTPAAAGPDLNQIKAGFTDAGPEMIKTTLVLVESSTEQARGLENFLETTLGAGKGVNFELLNKLLGEMKHALEPYSAAAGNGSPPASVEAGPVSDGGAQTVSPKRAPAMSGAIQGRADVLRALELICAYYREHEPSSPVPLILQRAQRLVDKDFMAIVSDLTPDALSHLQVITGIKPDK